MPHPVTVVGRHCESGDILATDVPLPEDVQAGDLLAVPVAGAYQCSMASSYNLVGRPPVVAVSDGGCRLLVRRETEADLFSRDLGLEHTGSRATAAASRATTSAGPLGTAATPTARRRTRK
jgi:diaminopimelate decarboxylase